MEEIKKNTKDMYCYTRWKNKYYFIHQQEAERKAEMNTKQMGWIENIYQDGIFRLNHTLSVTTLSVNWLNNSVKKAEIVRLDWKARLTTCYLNKKSYFKYKNTGWKQKGRRRFILYSIYLLLHDKLPPNIAI